MIEQFNQPASHLLEITATPYDTACVMVREMEQIFVDISRCSEFESLPANIKERVNHYVQLINNRD